LGLAVDHPVVGVRTHAGDLALALAEHPLPGRRRGRRQRLDLGELESLLAMLTAVGLRVEHEQAGEARALPSAVDLAAYRIVQESLTNAHKHGSSPAARLSLDYTPSGLGIVVTNPATHKVGGADGTGHGLIGRRERASSVGGTVRTGREADGVFTVRAFLPVTS
jgi:signal transduction histidine kinase